MHHVYLRVSTDHQDAENQKTGVITWLVAHGNPPLMLHTDTASGAVSWRERRLLPLLEQCEAGDTIVCAEVSRIGRSTIDVLDYFREATRRQVTTVVTKSGLIVDDSMGAKITTTILALAAEIEREFLLARTAEGYARARAAGVKVGRPAGSLSEGKLKGKHKEVETMLKARVPKTAIARLFGVSRGTLQRFINRNFCEWLNVDAAKEGKQ